MVSAPPDRGLATKQMSRKKKLKFWLTLGLACNADGSEKMPIFYIGYSKQPRVFKNQTPASRGFYYRNDRKKLADEAAQNSRLKICLPRHLKEQPSNPAPQLTAIEKDLMASVEELQKRKRIFGEPPMMEDLIQPPEERDGDVEEIEACDEVEIVAQIKRRISIESGEIIEVESDSDADAKDDPFPDIALADAIVMCEKLEKACIMLGYADGDMGLTLPQELRHFRGYLRQRESRNAKQITLTELWRK